MITFKKLRYGKYAVLVAGDVPFSYTKHTDLSQLFVPGHIYLIGSPTSNYKDIWYCYIIFDADQCWEIQDSSQTDELTAYRTKFEKRIARNKELYATPQAIRALMVMLAL